jgi:periplasmic protein TonB
MKETEIHMFEPSGCLNREAMAALVKDTLPAVLKEVARKHMESCPFCSDALEGYQLSEKDPMLLLSTLDNSFQVQKTKKQNRKKIVWLSVSIAASVALLVGIYLMFPASVSKPQLAENEIKRDKSVAQKSVEKVEPQKEIAVQNKQATVKPSSSKKTVQFVPPRVKDELSEVQDQVAPVREQPMEAKGKGEVKDSAISTNLADAKFEPAVSDGYFMGKKQGNTPTLNKRAMAYGTRRETVQGVANLNEKAEEEKNEPTTFVEQMPEFPGGEDMLKKFLNEHIKYPQAATEMGISGRVFVNFLVNKQGKISQIKVVRTIGGGCDEEAVRVVGLMPDWVAGKQNGRNVDVYYTLPIVFALSKK